GAGPIRAALQEHVVAVLVRAQAADARGDRRANALGFTCDLETRVRLGLARRRKNHLRESIHPPGGLAIDPLRRIEVLQLAGEVHVVGGTRVVERRDLRGAGLAREEVAPAL